ncbi:Ribonuclease HI [Planctomycetes bacterium Pan216]|uniref:Ribonuclease H n=1 Tax=Kolteria novifilia TaxID=2527975 RepID=A0A518B7J8_9BACT|nr:Ribonuclease HI [Planctomycetes bacterium Pan216]
MSETQPSYNLYSDGACSGNPGPGGWAYILRSESGEEVADSGAEGKTTNNRMEMMAVIEGLRKLSGKSRVVLITDSQYVSKGISEWMPGWKSRGWKRKVGRKLEPVKNVELWQELDQLLADHDVTCKWIRGHAGHAENEECDRMAVEAYRAIM